MTKILLVSPATSSRENLAEHLQKNGFAVFRAERASKGLSLLLSHRPELMILDQKLPDMDALSICVAIRQDASLNNTAVVMLTDLEREGEMVRALDCGADDYILRQANTKLILSRLRAVLRRVSHEYRETPNKGWLFKSGKLKVDLVGHYVWVGSKELQLSHKEYDLLVEFVQNPGIALSREFLLTKVWGESQPISSRTLDVHVRWLREKIEDDPSNPNHIITIRSLGYRFNAYPS
jgi:DNA-binding response OmpR family regulator